MEGLLYGKSESCNQESHGPASASRRNSVQGGNAVQVIDHLKFRENTANAKSVLSVLGACVKCGDEIEFVCEGEDEAEALKTLVEAVENGLGE